MPYIKSKFSLICLILVLMLSGCKDDQPEKPQVQRNLPQGIQAPDPTMQYEIAVIGSGAAGSMAAYRGVLNNNTVLLATGAKQAQRRSRGTWVPEFGNLPMFAGIKRPMYYLRNETIQQVINSPLKNNLYVLDGSITHIEKLEDGSFLLKDDQNQNHKAKYVILATGMMDEQPHIQDSIRPILGYANRQQAIYCLRCDGHMMLNQEAVAVIGFSESAAQNAILIKERYHPGRITILTNGESPQWSDEVNLWLERYAITVKTEEILDIEHNFDTLTGFKLEDQSIQAASLVLINLGVRVNHQLAKDLGAKLDEVGYVITNEDGLSSVAGLYAVGDLQANTMKQVYVAWLTGIKSADAINRELRLKQRAQWLD